MKRSRNNTGKRHADFTSDRSSIHGDDIPLDDDPDELSDLDVFPMEDDDAHWDAFIADDDEIDPLPDVGDFWFDDD